MLFSKYLNKYYLKYIIFYILGVVALIAVDYIQLFIPEFLGQLVGIFDAAGKTGTFTPEMTSDVIRIALYTILIGVGLMAGRMLWRFTLFHASHKIEADLRHDMFVKAEKLSVEYFHNNKVGNIMSSFTNDIETLQEYLGFGVVMMVDGFALSLMCIIKIFALSWQFLILLLIPMILIVIWGLVAEKIMSKKWFERQEAYDHLYDFTQESFTGIRVIKAFVKQRHQLRAFSKVAHNNKDVNVKFAVISVGFDAFIEIVIGLLFAVILGFGGYLALTGNVVKFLGLKFLIAPSDLVVLIGYFDTLIWPLIAMGQIVAMYSRSKASLTRIEIYMNAPEDIQNCENPVVLDPKTVKGKVEFKNFSFKYPSKDKEYLKDITLTIQPGESIGIVGRIGRGKTTLVNSLLRIYNIQENAVFIDDVDVMKADLASLRETVAYVPQDNFLFSDTVRGNIAFADLSLDDEKVKAAADFACVGNDIENFKDGYETVTGERGVTLSGGQKQRISIARAFIKNSPILILDDSVSAVDVKTEDTILKNIKEQRAGKTTLVVASRVSTVCHLDKIIVLSEGRVEAFDTHENLLKTSPTYAKMVYLQELEKEVEGR
ncbi:MAG: ABC transporter ATP-binding protein/permease [Bacilli bacterium]|nr:ABC transporter ATP-binding protein/permease [Bacilli bacterium]